MSTPGQLLVRWSELIIVHCDRSTTMKMRVVQLHFRFDPGVISHIRAIITTFLNGGALRLKRVVFTSPKPGFADTRLFKELYADIEFTCNVFKKQWRSECPRLLAVMPPMTFSLELTLIVLYAKDYNVDTSVKRVLHNLTVMSSCLNQCGASQDELDLLELIVEELLRRAALYALSISTGDERSLVDTWQNAYAIRGVTALELFNAIPGQLLCGHHLQRICDSYEFGCEGWKEIMRRALCVSREYGNVSLSRAWNGTCLLKP